MKSSQKHFSHFFKSFGYSLKGLKIALGETAFRQELFFFSFMFPGGLYLGDNGVEKALLVGCLFMVLIVELLNSSIESVVDRVGTEHHPLAGQAKDLASAAVFLALFTTICIWILILSEKYIS